MNWWAVVAGVEAVLLMLMLALASWLLDQLDVERKRVENWRDEARHHQSQHRAWRGGNDAA